MAQGKRILLLEVDKLSEQSIVAFLQEQGYAIQAIEDDSIIQQILKIRDFDLVLWSIAEFDSENLEIIRKIRREFEGPLLILSGMNSTKAQLDIFELGADDFIATPIDLRLLLARIRACLRRAHSRWPQNNIVQIGNLTVDREERNAKVGGQPLPLSTSEFDILWLLASHPKRALSREFLFFNALGRHYDGLDRAIDRRVSHLRRKLEKRQDLSLTVRTIWGRGYMLAAL